MTLLVVKSIPLSRDTVRAWKSTNQVTFLRRSRNGEIPHTIARRYDAILNLGNVQLTVGGSGHRIYNSPNSIRAVSTAPALRRTLGDTDLGVIPPYEFDGPHWHKHSGFGGEGKTFHEDVIPTLCHRMRGDVQQHVEGMEYRIISVGERIVQASRKDDSYVDTRTGRRRFNYTWVGVEGIRRGGFIPTIKAATHAIPNGERTIIGWDVIYDGEKPWIIEANTSPGVNEATAARISSAIRGLD
jgi:hypothetical protein